MFWIVGGILVNLNEKTVEPGTEECYGPFNDRKDAEIVWFSKARANMDNCLHRLFITDQDPSQTQAA